MSQFLLWLAIYFTACGQYSLVSSLHRFSVQIAAAPSKLFLLRQALEITPSLLSNSIPVGFIASTALAERLLLNPCSVLLIVLIPLLLCLLPVYPDIRNPPAG